MNWARSLTTRRQVRAHSCRVMWVAASQSRRHWVRRSTLSTASDAPPALAFVTPAGGPSSLLHGIGVAGACGTTGESPYGVAFDRAGQRLFVAASRSKLLQVFDTKDWNKVAEVPIGARCWHFTFTPDDRQILVACGRSDDVVVVDAQTLQPTKKIPAGKMPWGIVTYPKSIGSLDAP